MTDTKTTEETIWYDNTFEVYESRFGLFISKTKDGREIITSPTLEACVNATAFYLKGEQDGWPEPLSTYSGTVGGKL
jgi:hypothetical protein